jgi:ABC-type multidrug transport system ATPase subunit
VVKHRISEIDSLVDLLIYSFKHGKNLPFLIKTKNCPTKKKYCKRHHGEIVVTEHKKDTNKFHCDYYGVHERNVIFQFDQSEDVLKKIFKKYLRVQTKKNRQKNEPLMLVKDIKKIVGKIDRPIVQRFRVNKKEREKLLADAKKKDVSVGDFIRLKLFS